MRSMILDFMFAAAFAGITALTFGSPAWIIVGVCVFIAFRVSDFL